MNRTEMAVAVGIILFCILLGVAVVDETLNYLLNVR
jgi:hypothetical protein